MEFTPGSDINSDGIFQHAFQVNSEDNGISINIQAWSKGSDEKGQALTKLTLNSLHNIVPPPEDGKIIGLPFEFGPTGATFEPPLKLTLSLNELQLPANTTLNQIRIAVFNPISGGWGPLSTTIVRETSDHEIKLITGLAHFSIYGIIAYTETAVFIRNLNVTPAEPNTDGNVIISATVSNTTPSAAEYDVRLIVNDETSLLKRIMIQAGETLPVSFTINQIGPGIHRFDLNGLQGEFESGQRAEEEDRNTFNWWVVYIILGGGLISAALLISLRVLKKQNRFTAKL